MAEMLSCGVIAFSDMYFMADCIAQAVDESGMKANLSHGMTAFTPDFDYFKDRSHTETENIWNSYHNNDNGRIKADASIHGEYTSFERAWLQVSDYAKEKGLIMHLHLSESKVEHDNCKKKYGLTPAQVFSKHGIFDSKTMAAHCVWLEEEDMDILKEKNVTLVHNPVSNLKLSSGIAPISYCMEKGINVALGTDGPSSNNSQDLLADLKLASILQKNHTNNPISLPAHEALKLITTNGAKAQGRENESGQIAVGFDADIVVLDMCSPRQVPVIDPTASVVYSCSGRDVELTMCQGRILYEDGEYKTIDIEKTLFDANQAAKKLGISTTE
jgi:5-methylthioadenosine/S-adenosylhomocysteine deaminase